MVPHNHSSTGRRLAVDALALLCFTMTAAANIAPSVGIQNVLSVSKNSSYHATYADLVNLTSAMDSDGDEVQFVLAGVQNGSVLINGSIAKVGDVVSSSDNFEWAAPQGVYDEYVDAFQLRAFDGQDYSAAPIQISASISGNNPPQLSFVEPFSRKNQRNGHINEAFVLGFDSLKQASDLRDLDDDQLSFAIDPAGVGTIWINGQQVTNRAVFGSTNTLTWLPPVNAAGTLTPFKVVGFDGTDYSSAAVAVNVEITDPTPKFVKGANQKVLRDDFGQWVSNWATAIGPDEYALHFETTNDNPQLFLSQPELMDDGTLIYGVAPSAYGQANVTVVLADDHGHRSASQTFVIAVAFVNYAPDFQIPDTFAVNEDSGLIKVPGFASDITAGEGESSQTVTFTTAVTNTALYAIRPTVDLNGTLRFQTATNAAGDDLVTVTLKDNGGTSNGGQNQTTRTFVLHVTRINDAPTIALKSITFNEDAEGVAALGLSDIDTPASLLTADIDSFGALISSATVNQDSDSGSWTLHVVPQRDAFGTTSVNVRVSDGSTSVVYPVKVTITAVNDAPSFDLSSDSAVVLVAGQVTTKAQFITHISAGAANETNQSVSFVLSASDPTFFATAPTVSADGTLRFKVADNVSGSNLVSVIARDNGGTANGGINQSAAKSFYVVSPKNPFSALKGNYSGLFYEADEVRHTTSGAITMALTDKGACSGKLQLAGVSYGFAGQFFLDSHADVKVTRAGKTPLYLTLFISANGVTGTVTDLNWTANVVVSKAATAVPQAGKYTFGLNDADGVKGVATLNLGASGSGSGVIYTSDGQTVSFSGSLNQQGQLAVYVPCFAGTGSVLGWVNVTTTNVSGSISRIHVASINGVTNILQISGSPYVAPASGQLVLKPMPTSAILDSGASTTVSASANNVVTGPTWTLNLKLNAATGLFTGSFVHPVTRSVVTVKGVALQNSNEVAGFFTSRDVNGAIELR